MRVGRRRSPPVISRPQPGAVGWVAGGRAGFGPRLPQLVFVCCAARSLLQSPAGRRSRAVAASDVVYLSTELRYELTASSSCRTVCAVAGRLKAAFDVDVSYYRIVPVMDERY